MHAVLFWMSTCPHCHEVIEEVLPPLREQHGPHLDIRLVEICSSEEFERLYPLAVCYGIPPEDFGVPFLIIGEEGLHACQTETDARQPDDPCQRGI